MFFPSTNAPPPILMVALLAAVAFHCLAPFLPALAAPTNKNVPADTSSSSSSSDDDADDHCQSSCSADCAKAGAVGCLVLSAQLGQAVAARPLGSAAAVVPMPSSSYSTAPSPYTWENTMLSPQSSSSSFGAQLSVPGQQLMQRNTLNNPFGNEAPPPAEDEERKRKKKSKSKKKKKKKCICC